MSKYCGNCGAELSDEVRVCGFCGTPCQNTGKEAEKKKISGTEYHNPEKHTATTKKVKWGIAAGILVIAAAVICNVAASFTGYHGLIRKVMKAYENYDIDALLELSSEIYFYGAEEFVEYYFENTVGRNLDSIEENVGHNSKLSYEVKEVYSLSERKQSELLNELSSIYQDFDVSVIEKIKVAEIAVTAKQGKKSMDCEVKLTMTREAGKWKLLYID